MKERYESMDAYGVNDRVLEIDLTSGETDDYRIPREYRKEFLGGKGLALRLLADRMEPGCDPLGDDNRVAIMTGPMSGSPFPSSARFAVVSKSPLTSLMVSSICGGPFGYNLKRTGYDGIILRGSCRKPSYITITDDEVTIGDASGLWGKDTFETQHLLSAEGHSLVIGPAGERRVRFACLVSGRRYAGRGGIGAVFGAKNLKGVAVKGTRKLTQADPDRLDRLIKTGRRWLKRNHKTAESLPRYGTPAFVNLNNEFGILPTCNFQSGRFPGAPSISGEKLNRDHFLKNEGCPSCPIRCGRIAQFGKREMASPEYESTAMLGSNLGIDDIDAVASNSEWCNRLGMDTISAGGVLGFAMEMTEKGLLESDLRFGHSENIPETLEKIAFRKDIGDELAEGVRRLSQKYGGGDFAMHVKGLEIPAYDPRGCYGQGLAYATTNRGGCHLSGGTHPMAVVNGFLDPLSTQAKPEMVIFLQNLYDALNSSVECLFTIYAFVEETTILQKTPRKLLNFFLQNFPNLALAMIDVGIYPSALSATLGVKISRNAFLRAGERTFNLERLLNLREGLDTAMDTLPPRLLREPLDEDPERVVPLETMLEKYYVLRGWSPGGIPAPTTMKHLDLERFSPIP